ncbi:cytoplasmic protein [Bacillus cereus]|nr:cytoplasmic protein [Bacillus cereus]
MVFIRASRCIYPIPLQEWNDKWKPHFPPCEEWFVEVGEKYVTLEYGEFSYRMSEDYFARHILPTIPYELRKQALKRGKGVSRVEKSYDKKGVKKHATTKDWR